MPNEPYKFYRIRELQPLPDWDSLSFHPENEYFLYAPYRSILDSITCLPCPSLSCISPKGLWKKCHSAWRSISITRSLEKITSLFITVLVMSFHSISESNSHPKRSNHPWFNFFCAIPQCYPPIDRFIYTTYKFGKACQCKCHDLPSVNVPNGILYTISILPR